MTYNPEVAARWQVPTDTGNPFEVVLRKTYDEPLTPYCACSRRAAAHGARTRAQGSATRCAALSVPVWNHSSLRRDVSRRTTPPSRRVVSRSRCS